MTTNEPSASAATGLPMAVVAVGASAGGLAALEALFGAVPAQAQVAWLVATHLAPEKKSLLPELLSRATPLRVQAAQDGDRIRSRHVYVMPPATSMTVCDGYLRLAKRNERDVSSHAVDTLFCSLALDRRARSIGIVLSGTGSDGTQGLEAIKSEGGMTMAQDESAKHRDMPRSAIAAGLADFVLSPERMPAALLEYLERRAQQSWAEPPPDEDPRRNALQQILDLLRARTGHDFSQYKTTTIYRRLSRRMALHHIVSLDDYVEHLRADKDEAHALFGELLINVTSFFRDLEAFETLKRPHLFELLKNRASGEPVRAWVPGCSTGEEAYTIAMMLLEVAAELDIHANVQVFATDIDKQAIKAARAGTYPDAIRANVSEERLQRFFTPADGGGFQVCKTLRDSLIVAPQSVIRDPPLSKLDLLSCRNLLIYLGADIQTKLVSMFHYALRPEGLLLLGSSESIGRAGDLFHPVDRKWKIFRKVNLRPARNLMLDIPVHQKLMPTHDAPPSPDDTLKFNAAQLMKAVLRQSDAPPCAVIDAAMKVHFVYGKTGRFLEPAEGLPSHNVLDMARPGLRTALATCVRTALRNRGAAEQHGVTFESDGQALTLNLEVRPVVDPAPLADLLLVLFKEVPPTVEPGPDDVGNDSDSHAVVQTLERQLSQTKDSLQSAIEELETANEELRSSNEELQSTNEELQSSNEELETSKEELQSLNEESGTVNVELQSRLEELSRANDDLNNLLLSTGIATIFLDTELCVRRFTPLAAELFPLTSGDEGRQLSHFAPNLLDVDIEALTQAMLDDLVVREQEVVAKDGRRFMMKVRPYKTINNVIDGAVITFEDRTELERATQTMREEIAGHRAQALDLNANQDVEDPDG